MARDADEICHTPDEQNCTARMQLESAEVKECQKRCKKPCETTNFDVQLTSLPYPSFKLKSLQNSRKDWQYAVTWPARLQGTCN